MRFAFQAPTYPKESCGLRRNDPDPGRPPRGLTRHGSCATGQKFADIACRLEGALHPQVPMSAAGMR